MTANLDRVIVRLNNAIVQTVALDQPVLTIGRAAEMGLRLSHPRVSRHHAEVRRSGDVVTIVDLGSANGLVVDGARLAAHQPLALTSGAVAEIGPYTLIFHLRVGAEPPVADYSDETIVDVRMELQIHMDEQRRHDQVEEIAESDFFRHLREEKQRLRPSAPKQPDDKSP